MAENDEPEKGAHEPPAPAAGEGSASHRAGSREVSQQATAERQEDQGEAPIAEAELEAIRSQLQRGNALAEEEARRRGYRPRPRVAAKRAASGN